MWPRSNDFEISSDEELKRALTAADELPFQRDGERIAASPFARNAVARGDQRVGSNVVTRRRNDASRYSRLITSAISSAVANFS